MQPLLSYYGGKQRIADKLLALLPRHTCYCEPFAGGAALLFHKPMIRANAYVEAINDKDALIYTCYKVAREQPEELQRRIALTPYGQAEYEQARTICQNPERHDDISIAWAVYCNCNFSFANKMYGGLGYSQRNNPATQNYNRCAKLTTLVARLSTVQTMNIDAIEFIEKFDREATCFYCDPPYLDSNQGHYGGYTQDDFNRLIDCLDNIKGSFLLSTYANDALQDKGWELHTINVHTSAALDTNADKTEQEAEDKQRTEHVYIKRSAYGMPGNNLELCFG